MGFRILEISREAEIHINNGQLQITNMEGVFTIPIEDIDQIMAHGANIRLSTMDLSILSQNKVGLVTLDDRYLPTAMVLPFEGHARQSRLMHAQIGCKEEVISGLWKDIIRRKIENQARALSILGRNGIEQVMSFIEDMDENNVDVCESLSAKVYFRFYHEGLNRRTDDPINSRMNYGYAVVRSYIARTLVACGFHPTFGIHHNNQLNAFNLADDLIEPYRACVDIVVHETLGDNVILSRTERKELAHILYNACIMDNVKMNIASSIVQMVESLKRIILNDSKEQLTLPTVIPIENMEGITE